MNFIEDESPEKLRGGYYTPPDIAAFLARWVTARNVRDLLEPSAGDGVFIRALSSIGAVPERIVACELEAQEAVKAERSAQQLAPGVESQILAGDFLAWALDKLGDTPLFRSFGASESFDGVLGNPPFIRYQYLDPRLQERSEQIIRQFDLRFTKHTNAWVPFVVASVALLRPGGRLGMVVPSELLHVLHAQSARSFLIDQCSRVLVLDPEELWFEGTLQGVVLLLAEKRSDEDSRPAEVAVRKVNGRQFLSGDPEDLFESSAYASGGDLPGKWMLALLEPRQRELLLELGVSDHVRRFDDVAKVAVGIVTGANKFFLVPDETVEQFELHEFAKPMFGRSEHVPGVIYDDAVHAANRAAGLPANFIWFNGTRRSDLREGPLAYVRFGEASGLHRRYKCRIREPWFTVPSVFSTSVGMLKRSHDYPRLVLNQLEAYTTDTAYRIVPTEMSGAELVCSFVNSLTALTAELEGRHYGGGVLELVPSEIKRLLIPTGQCGHRQLRKLDAACRDAWAPERVFDMQDREVLAPLGLTSVERDELAHAWWTLRNRRQRNGLNPDVHRGNSSSAERSRTVPKSAS